MKQSLYASLLQESFESLKSSADPDSRPTGGGPTIELSTPESDVLGKIIPVKNDLKAALQTSGWLVKGDGTLDEGEEKGPTPAEEPSTEASGHDPATVYKLQEDRKLTNEQNLVINGVFIPDLIPTVLSKMDMMRCKQAALDVVLDRVSLLRAQARVMDVIDSALWAEAFKLIKIEVANCQHVLDEGLTFEEVILNAMRDGVDMVELADTLGVEFTQIAEVVLNID